MKTIRKGVFETNSSSCHCVTLMSEKEYNSLTNNESILVSDKCTLFNKEWVANKVSNLINYHKDFISKYEAQLLRLKGFEEKGVSNLTKEEKKEISWSVMEAPDEKVKAELLENIERYTEYVESTKEELENDLDKSSDIDKVYEKVSIIFKDMRSFKDSDFDDFSDYEEGVLSSEDEFEFYKRLLEDVETYESWGGDYETDSTWDTIDGVKVYALSYYGYD